jgi:ATP-dependent helicase/nuclease subunit A
MPAHSNLNLGAIAFSKASAVRPEEGGVECYAAETREMEGAWIANKILTLQKEHPEYTIAVLARNRRHLESTLLALKAAKIRFVAQDLDTLAQNPMIQDLLTLLAAMLNIDNRLAWLSLLRTPWIGLSLTDCTRIVEWAKGKEGQSVWEALLDFQSMTDLLSLSAQKRLLVIMPVLQRWMEQRQIGALMDWIRTLWIALGGPAPYPAPHREAAELFFQSLSATFWGTFAFEDFKEEINQAFDNRSIEAGAIQLMTIHKAKGLEFDVVFLPGLTQRSGSDGAQLMLWLDYPTHHGVDWLLAPIRAYEEDEDRIYGYLSSLQRQKSQYETGRLFYVAITRAAKKAFLCMTLTKSEEGGWNPPAAGCFAGLLWGAVTPQPIELLAEATTQTGVGKQWPRMPESWILPRPIQEAIALDRPIEIDQENAVWQQLGYAHNAREILEEQSGFGTAVHRLLEGMSTLGFETWMKRFKGFNILNWQRFLARFGVLQPEYSQKLSHWVSCLEHDIQLQWILRAHREARSEWVIYDQEYAQKYIIDRAFVDEEGVRWIVDYKTSELETDKASAQWQNYQEQLETYARVVRRIDNHPERMIKTALYYPFTRELQIVPA